MTFFGLGAFLAGGEEARFLAGIPRDEVELPAAIPSERRRSSLALMLASRCCSLRGTTRREKGRLVESECE